MTAVSRITKGDVTDEIVGAISVGVFCVLLIILVYWANCRSAERHSFLEIGKILRPNNISPPMQVLAERRKQFLQLTSLESRKITPIVEEDDDDDGDGENSEIEEKDTTDDAYGTHFTVEQQSISLDSTSIRSEDIRGRLLLKRRNLGHYHCLYLLSDPVPAKPPYDVIELENLNHNDTRDWLHPPDIELPDEDFYT